MRFFTHLHHEGPKPTPASITGIGKLSSTSYGGISQSIRRLYTKVLRRQSSASGKVRLVDRFDYSDEVDDDAPATADRTLLLSNGSNLDIPKGASTQQNQVTETGSAGVCSPTCGNLSVSEFSSSLEETLIDFDAPQVLSFYNPKESFARSFGNLVDLNLGVSSSLDLYPSATERSASSPSSSPFDDRFSIGSSSPWGSNTSINTFGKYHDETPLLKDANGYKNRSRNSSLASTNPEYYGLSCKPSRRGSFLDLEIKEQMKKTTTPHLDQELKSPTEKLSGKAPKHHRLASSIYSSDEVDSPKAFGFNRQEDDNTRARRFSGSSTKSLTTHPNVNILDFPLLGNPFLSTECLSECLTSENEDYFGLGLSESRNKENQSVSESTNEITSHKTPFPEHSHGFNQIVPTSILGLSLDVIPNSEEDFFGGMGRRILSDNTKGGSTSTLTSETSCNIKREKIVIRRVRRVNRSKSEPENDTVLEIDEEEVDPMSKWRRRRDARENGSEGNRVASSSF